MQNSLHHCFPKVTVMRKVYPETIFLFPLLHVIKGLTDTSAGDLGCFAGRGWCSFVAAPPGQVSSLSPLVLYKVSIEHRFPAECYKHRAKFAVFSAGCFKYQTSTSWNRAIYVFCCTFITADASFSRS